MKERDVTRWIPRRDASVLAALLLGVLCSAPVVAPVAAQDEPEKAAKRPAMLIQPAELEAKRGERDWRVLDTRSKGDYEKSHIPGAVWVDVSSWQALGKRDGGFRDAAAWAKKVGELGIDAETRTVVYGSSLSNTARVWWLLKYVGARDVLILDGGWDLWVKERRPMDAKAPAITATRFEPRLDADRLMEIEPLKELLPKGKVKIVDTRSDGEFSGATVRGKRGGRIPGATHLEWVELIAEDGRFKSVAALQELFRMRGILPSETAVCY